jgi:hypothetical protein
LHYEFLFITWYACRDDPWYCDTIYDAFLIMINCHDGIVLLVTLDIKLSMSLDYFECKNRYLSHITPNLLAINVQIEKNFKLLDWTFNDSANHFRFSNVAFINLFFCDFYHIYIFVFKLLSFIFWNFFLLIFDSMLSFLK